MQQASRALRHRREGRKASSALDFLGFKTDQVPVNITSAFMSRRVDIRGKNLHNLMMLLWLANVIHSCASRRILVDLNAAVLPFLIELMTLSVWELLETFFKMSHHSSYGKISSCGWNVSLPLMNWMCLLVLTDHRADRNSSSREAPALQNRDCQGCCKGSGVGVTLWGVHSHSCCGTYLVDVIWFFTLCNM